MPAKISTHVFKGMQKDINVANASNDYLFDAHNIRLNQLDDTTLMSIVNEKGNEHILNVGISTEDYVSHYVIDNYIVVFTHKTVTENNTTKHYNCIYRIDVTDSSTTIRTLFDATDLSIRPDKPLEFTSYFEAEGVIKIYWVDGENQLRFMNIMEELKNIADPGDPPVYRAYTNPNDFNTTPELQLEETVTVELIEGNGLFPAGVVQYALTYINKLGVESNIFYTSKLHSIQYPTRAASPLEFINCTFKITISDFDDSFDYIRCYQLLRTSLDAQPTCLILNEVPLEDKVSGIDDIIIFDNNNGSQYDPTSLLFQKYPVVPYTLDLKSNTLFLGNLREDVFEIPDTDLKNIMDFFKNKISFANSTNQDTDITYNNEGTPSYRFNASADKIRTFKSGETYRIGVLFQDEFGVWSLPVYIKDLYVNCTQLHNSDVVYPICFQYNGTGASVPNYISKYKRFRFLMVNPSAGDRSRLAQGLVTPTMYELSDRIFNAPHAYSSWFARPFNSNVANRLNQLIPSAKDWEAEILASLMSGEINSDLTTTDWYTNQVTYPSIYTDDNVEDTSSPAILDFNLDFHIYGVATPLIYIRLNYCTITKQGLNLTNNRIGGTDIKYHLGGNTSDWSSENYSEYDDSEEVVYLRNGESPQDLISSEIITVLGNASGVFTQIQSLLTTIETNLITLLDEIILKEKEELKDSDDFWVNRTILVTTSNITIPTQYIVLPSGKISAFGFNAGLLCDFRVDHSILNLYSPDINDSYYEIHNNGSLDLNLVGYTKVDSLLDIIFIKLLNAGSSSNSTVAPLFNYSKTNAGKNFEFARNLYKDSTIYKRFRDGSTAIMRESGMLTEYDAEHTTVWINGIKVCPTKYDLLLLNSHAPLYDFIVYPWHGSGSLNNEDNTDGDARSATYTKIFAKEWICGSTNYYDIDYSYKYKLDPSDVTSVTTHNISGCECERCFVCNNTNNVIIIKQDGKSKTYIGNPDLARTFVTKKNGIIEEPQVEFGYDIYILENNTFKALSLFYYYAHTHNTDGKLEKKTLFNYPEMSNVDNRYPQSKNEKTSWKPVIYKTDPILIKYNCDTHVVIPINRNNNRLTTLPILSVNDNWKIGDTGLKGNASDYYPLWDNSQEYFDIIPHVYDDLDNTIECEDSSYFHIGELVRDLITRYNGAIDFSEGYDKNDPILISNVFIPIMESESTDLLESTFKTNYGDTWYGRWDCLKTLHKTDLDELSVHDYVSIMIESHINLNGRYDSYRNFYDLTLVNAQNANKFNDVYNQMDTFWSYKVTPNYLGTYVYPNLITWSLTKQTGALVDEWTRVLATNSEELDGIKGKIRKILNYGDSLFVFQDRCISQIKYNELTLITTTEGVPVEISNSLKVTGIVKIYDGTGCINKWSIASDSNGIFFVDNANEAIMWLGGNLNTPLINLTSNKAFNLFMKVNNSFDIWNPKDFNNFVTFIDSAHKDVYFVNKDKCLCFSLVLLEFISFYDYERTFGMFNINNNFYSLYAPYTVNQLTLIGSYGQLKLYRNFTGKYNEIYDSYKPTTFTFIDHGESFLIDKTFTNINYIQDAYDVSTSGDGYQSYKDDYDDVDYSYMKDITFQKLRVWTPFLDTGDITLSLLTENIQRKFRTWGIQIARDLKYNAVSDVDRIRNNWAKFKFVFELPDKNVMINPRDIKIELMNINILSIE